jgi:hypothetical protein
MTATVEASAVTESELAWIRSVAVKRASFRGYQRRADSWGRGFIPSPTLVGLCGEYALCNYLNRCARCALTIDATLRRLGDDGADVVANGVRIQVKTMTIRGGAYLVRYDEHKPIRCDVFVFARWNERRPRVVELDGWVDRAAVLHVAPIVRSPRAGAEHYNYDVPREHLRPMRDLCAEILRGCTP